MALAKTDNVALRAIYVSVPKNIFSNINYDYISPAEREKLIKITGIKERRYCNKGVTTSDLCEPAVEKVIYDLGWPKHEIDALIFVSQLRDYSLPCTAPILQYKLGLSTNCLAYDIPLGCSGYVYGLFTIASMMQTGHIKKAILITGDVGFNDLSPRDSVTFPLFGDAVGVTALEYDPKASPIYYSLNSDGKDFDCIIKPDGGSRNPTTEESLVYHEHNGNWRNALQVKIDGLKLFTFTSNVVAKDMRKLCEYFELDLNNIDLLFLHQANQLLNETIRKQLKFSKEKVPYSLDRFGNTSSASIPLTIVDSFKNEMKIPKCIALSGFGVGTSWASAVIPNFNTALFDLIELN
jgi:3-oxoacyl-[acyl-carrier-protein] synthase-3